MQKKFDIPIEPHLVNFAKKEFWDGYDAPYPINERTLIGKQVFLYLIDKRKFKKTAEEKESILSVILSDTLAKRSPDLIKLSRINNFLDDIFKRDLKIWVSAQVESGLSRYRAVVSFLRYYDIDHADFIQRYYQYIMRLDHKPFNMRTKLSSHGKMEG